VDWIGLAQDRDRRRDLVNSVLKLKDATLLDNRLIDGGKVVNPTHRLHFTPQKQYFF
jgi:hypothetical protein